MPLAVGFAAGLHSSPALFGVSTGATKAIVSSPETRVIDTPPVGGPVDIPLEWLTAGAAHERNGTNGAPWEGGEGLGAGETWSSSVLATASRSRESRPSRDLVLFSLPGEEPETPRAADRQEVRDEECPQIVTYVVNKGDTLSSIAAAHSTTVASICAINGIESPDTIVPGQHLTIVKNAAALVRRVARGDTLWDIARAYGVTVDSIIRANGLAGDVIIPGQLLIIPVVQIPRETWVVASAFKGEPLEWPVFGRVTSGFGWRIHPISGVRHFHEGLDIAAALGTPVRAVASGRVIFAGYLSGYGRVVALDHGNGLVTRYAHLSKATVSRGDQVSTGQVIGYVGDSGYATGPHLHFEVRIDDQALDPRKFLR